MKKILLIIFSASAVLGTAKAVDYLLQANVPIGESWNSDSVWFDQPSGGGDNPTVFSGNDFFLNGFGLRTGSTSTGTSTFNGASLNFGQSGDLMDLMAATSTINNTLNVTTGFIRNHTTRDNINFNIGTLNVSGTNFQLRAPGSTQTMNVNASVLSGDGRLNFGNLSGTDSGNFSFTTDDADAFTGELRPIDGTLEFSTAFSLTNGTLYLSTLSGVNVRLANNVSFAALEGDSFSPIAPGTYNASELNSLTSSSVFIGGSNLTVIPEPGTWVLILGLFAASLLVFRHFRNS